MGAIPYVKLNMSTRYTSTRASYYFSLDFTPYPLKQLDQIRFDFYSGYALNYVPTCIAPFYLYNYGSSPGLYCVCTLNTANFTQGILTIQDSIQNPVYFYLFIFNRVVQGRIRWGSPFLLIILR